jgi:cytochrome c oxidase subunit 4
MNEHESEELRHHVRIYLMVFAALGVLTVVTVGIAYLHMSQTVAISAAIIVASVKASLVALFFMHLVSEEKVIVWLLLLCAAFLAVLMALPVLTESGAGPLWPL